MGDKTEILNEKMYDAAGLTEEEKVRARRAERRKTLLVKGVWAVAGIIGLALANYASEELVELFRKISDVL